MNFYKSKVITNPDTDYRKIDKVTFKALSELLSDTLSKYGCMSAVKHEFHVNQEPERDTITFDEYFDNSAIYDNISFHSLGRTADKSKKLDIIVVFNFYSSKPKCHIILSGANFTDAQQTDIFEAIGNFIYETAKAESPEQDTNNSPTNTVSEKPKKKQKRITKLPKWLFPVAGGTIIIGLAQVLDIFNGIFEFFTNICSLF